MFRRVTQKQLRKQFFVYERTREYNAVKQCHKSTLTRYLFKHSSFTSVAAVVFLFRLILECQNMFSLGCHKSFNNLTFSYFGM